MPFELGNQEAKKANRKRARLVQQQLTSALNEAHDKGITKLRAVIDRWIANAISGDQAAINAIADRVDGKAAQAIVGDDESDPVNILQRIERIIVRPEDKNG
jgi:hypothetical protein